MRSFFDIFQQLMIIILHLDGCVKEMAVPRVILEAVQEDSVDVPMKLTDMSISIGFHLHADGA